MHFALRKQGTWETSKVMKSGMREGFWKNGELQNEILAHKSSLLISPNIEFHLAAWNLVGKCNMMGLTKNPPKES